jgi:hypothetical protein
MAAPDTDEGAGYVDIQSGPDAGTRRYKPANPERKPTFVNASEGSQMAEEDASHSSSVPSNAGRAAQSTDAQNQY